jgi:hypoxanthine phosphoribosyltransferase
MQAHHVRAILFSKDQIRRRVASLAATIAQDYAPGELTIIAVLKGSFIFLADLVRHLTDHELPLLVDFLLLSSYGRHATSTGRVDVLSDCKVTVAGQRVLLLDDILDTGLTLQTARDLILARGAREVRTCVLLDKPARRRVPIRPDYFGFEVADVFVVGYGLDYDGRYRQLPHIAAVTFTDQAGP